MKMDAVGIVSKDLSKSVAFYRLLDVHFEKSPGSEDHYEATLPSGLRLMLDSENLMKQIKPHWRPVSGGAITLGFLMPTPENVNSVFEVLKATGATVEVEPWDAFWGQRYATVCDPDGNPVDLFASLGDKPL